MRLNQILSEKIVNQPRDRAAFLGKAERALRQIASVIEPICEEIKRLDRDGEGYSILRWAESGRDVPLPSAHELNINRYDAIGSVAHSLDAIVRFGASTHDFVGHAVAAIGRVEWPRGGSAELRDTLDHMEQRLVEYGFEPGQDYSDDPEYRDARAMLNAYRAALQAIQQAEAVIARVNPVLADLQRRLANNYRPEQYRPEHGEVETLYHASLYATEIARDGFAAEKPIERIGVGNYGQQNSISFTHDLRVAHDIMRAFREVWMIVHGQLSHRAIVGWFRHEGLDLKFASGLFGTSKEAPDSIRNTVGLYRAYLGLTKLRYNPMLVNTDELIPVMTGRAFEDIGIVSCAVDLTGENEYKHAEAEFRVPAAKVVGAIKRLV